MTQTTKIDAGQAESMREMLAEAGVCVCVNSLLVKAIVDGPTVKGVIVESRSGREAILGRSFVDCTGYGDLAAYAGAQYTEPNDYAVANSIGVGGVSLEEYHRFLESHDALREYSEGVRSGQDGKIVRLNGNMGKLPDEFARRAREIGMSRSGFSARFTALVGEPVLHYLTQLRMQLAYRQLVETSDSLAKIAARIGYNSEPAFSRAFKRVTGTPPGAVRKGEMAS